MKKILISFSALLVTGLAHAQLSPTENYVYSKTYLDYNGTTPTKTSETVQYFDGLGRPKQVVNVKASPLGKDVVTPIVYDGFGRQVKDYLPVPQSNTLNGAIITDPLSSITTTPYGAEKIYSEKILENSPLDRVLQQKQVGNAWDNKPVQFQYDANTVADNVRKFTTVTTWENGATKSVLGENWLYTDGQLYKNTVTDEDGNKTIEFKNGQGQLIMVRKEDGSSTYYVYNEYNQLAFVIPPLASIRGDIVTNTTKHDELCYQYKYDGRGRLVEKKLPGKGWEYMVYDKADRLILTQDAVMKPQNKWLMTKYDAWGRVAYTGTFSSTDSRSTIQNQIADLVIYDVRHPTGIARNGITLYYTNVYFSVETLLSVNYYDTYPQQYSFNPPFPTEILGQAVLTDTPDAEGLSTKSLPVVSFVKNIEDDNWTKNYTYYDKKGRAIGSYSINHLGGYTKAESKLDFAGVVLNAVTKHKRLSTDTEKVINEIFEYDHQNRLLSHKHQVDNNPVEYLTQNSYNEISQITNKKVGGVAPSSPLQSVDYTYNIRGWMTKINDPANLNGKLFGYEMKYQNPQTDPGYAKFNGNISEIDWKTPVDGVLRRYTYAYDPLSRLTAAYYQEPYTSLPYNNFFNEEINYDLNGNILRLQRTMKSTVSNTPEYVDNISYDYLGNRLSSATDQTDNYRGYPGTAIATGHTISYDDNGNMTTHEDKGISAIGYNFLNLPRQITTSQGNTTYNYRADGGKVRKTFGSKITDYLDSFQYENAVLKFSPTSEGYFNFENNKYIYNYTDHLGNIRISYFNNGSGVEVLEENNYYPFGLKHEGYNILSGNPAYNYKYNGKELQETGMYDYGARFYMPDLGRWGVVDELAEKSRRFSTYTYALDNPIMFVDPDGREAQGCCGNLLKLASTYYSGMYQGAKEVVTEAYHGVKQLVTNPKGTAKSIYNNPGGILKAGVSKSVGLMVAIKAGPAIASASLQSGDGTVAGKIAGRSLAEMALVAGTEGAGSAIRGLASKAAAKAERQAAGSINQLTRQEMGTIIGGGAMDGKRLGHTFTKHGAENTTQLELQATNSGIAQGQWIDNVAAEQIIFDNLGSLKNGAINVEIPNGVGRVINPDGTFSPATHARLIPSGSGVKTAYPLNP